MSGLILIPADLSAKNLEVKEEETIRLLTRLIDRLMVPIMGTSDNLHHSTIGFEGQKSLVRIQIVYDKIEQAVNRNANTNGDEIPESRIERPASNNQSHG